MYSISLIFDAALVSIIFWAFNIIHVIIFCNYRPIFRFLSSKEIDQMKIILQYAFLMFIQTPTVTLMKQALLYKSEMGYKIFPA